ncbi:MAG: ATP synthase subunit I [Candidatus Jettenia sp.]|uniref:ATP synthase subunit I n=1 Tax=Candidatus Jettenia caeni TaxID=247490 RepID=I3ILM4_9BACT|nr:ATP synthase subunit I [Candidatus Jettenia sp. AMX1]MBC6927357.1 ATP synthase subunit I [Candidatus Jettenia sp.]NUN24269.1 ATP synthase subunit I [Candidatus Jettenia caeni]KAA0251734.1 MAG: ATP synthase subunit I [Candidatus Jettenia sp. AMX1]MCE7879040.1 ATP synthase subunit I [Candidatus Jettenia sp. AMX1]MCQ3925786.1 ATP synthase subunit I [Candidatus Jettenia sp.]
MANDIIFIVLSLANGIGLSILYFGGLWLTVQVLPVSGRPAFFMAGSFLMRIAAILCGLYVIIPHGEWKSFLAFMLGFLFMRIVLIQRLQSRHINFRLLLKKR